MLVRRKRPRLLRAISFLTLYLIALPLSVALASSGGGQEAGPKGWVATDTYRVMNFVLLAGGLIFLLRKPLSQALRGRIKGIQDQLSELEAKKKEAEKELAAYTEKLALLDQEAQKLIDEYIKQGNEAKARILQEAETAAQKLEEQAQRNIEHEFKQAKLKLQQEALEKALAKAEEIIKSKVTSQDQERLVDEYLKKVVV
ncbi:MAG: ATP synthase F0 subunit B [Desulfobacterales bacterium]